MPERLPIKLAQCRSKGYVIAPAGYGKTHLIALAVKASSRRQLVLTHTFAGVNSIKTKLNQLRVPSSKFQVDTIASWMLRLCLAYPTTSGWTIENPTAKQWNELYEASSALLKKEFIRHVINCTYDGVYVDEYQDCSELQHTAVSTFAEFMPFRVLGDPLQSIFDFADKPVDWGSNIFPHFECLGELHKPWRWHNAGAKELGEWLHDVRTTLISNDQIDLTVALPKGVSKISVDLDDYRDSKRHKLFYDFLKYDTKVIVIYAGDQKSKNKAHKLAQTLGGKFSSIEEVECKTLFTFLRKLESARTPSSGFTIVLDFAQKCFTGVNKTLTAGTKVGQVAKKSKVTKYPDILEAANNYLTTATSQNLMFFICLVRDNPETCTYRRDLLNRFLSVLRIQIDGEAPTLLESAHVFQREFRHTGRPVRHTKLIGTTLLVKGLEYDHAIVLGADSLNSKELYVALTRGSKSVTIVTGKDSIP